MACTTCNGSEKYKDLNHVKIIAETYANTEKQDVGIWFDGSLYHFEPTGFTGRKYLLEIQFNREPANTEFPENIGNEKLSIPIPKKSKKK